MPYLNSLHNRLGVIRLPTHLRSLVLNNCISPRPYASAAAAAIQGAPTHKALFDLLSNTSRKQTKEVTEGGGEGSGRRHKDSKRIGSNPRVPLRQQLSARSAPKRIEENQLEKVLPVNISDQVLRDEDKARHQVYDYAASQGLIPEVVIEPKRSAKKHTTRRAGKIIQITIKLPDQGIEGSAVSATFKKAEIGASIKFKESAEQYQREHQGDATDKSNNFHLLTCATAPYFFDYLRILNRQAEYKLATEQTQCQPKHGETYFIAWVTDEAGAIVGPKVPVRSQKNTDGLVWLATAVEIAKKDPKILEGFKQAMIEGNGKILPPMPFLDLNPGALVFSTMHQVLRKAHVLGLPEVKEESNLSELSPENRRFTKPSLSPAQIQRASENLSARLEHYEWNPRLEPLRNAKEALPMNQYRDQVLKMINKNVYSIVVGATGSGKTTQVPQILLDDAIKRGEGALCDIICTQPRRIAAISVAQRVAVERDEPLRQTIGYQVRFDRQLPAPGGSVTFCTTGILLEQLKHDPDQVFQTLTHLLIDEVHERDLNIDYLMIILKKAIKTRQAAGKSVPRIVLMSATLDTNLFSKYFNSSEKAGVITPCPSISVPGRTFPVKEKYLAEIMDEMTPVYGGELSRLLRDVKCSDYLRDEKAFSASNYGDGSTEGGESVIDWKRQNPSFGNGVVEEPDFLEGLVPVPLVAATLAHICNTTSDGAILVFLPGLQEILGVEEILRTREVLGVDFMDHNRFKVSLLHSSVSKEDQSAVFETVPPGCRKIILSTNIAETSVTIPDVQYVIDSGKLREKRYDQTRRITKLQCTWISKSNSKQRAGRAGRVQHGNYYALFSRERFENLRSIGLPELLRSDLQETCLTTKVHAQHEPVGEFLAQAIEPPAPAAVATAVKSLQAMEAFTETEEITALGQLLARLPVHPTLGKMIVLGVIFKCLDPLLILSAASEEKSLLMEPIGARVEARDAHRAYHAGQKSDHIMLLNAFNHLREIKETRGLYQANDYGHRNFLHMGTFKNISKTAGSILDILVEVGLMPRVSPLEVKGFMFGHPALNVNSHSIALIKCLILAGFHPNLAAQRNPRGFLLRTRSEQNLMMSQASINATKKTKRDDSRGDNDRGSPSYVDRMLFTYTSLHSSNDGSLNVRDTTVVTPLMATLFASKLNRSAGNQIKADKWLPFYVKGEDPRAATNLILDFKDALNRVMSHSFRSLSSLSRGSLPKSDVRDTVTQGVVDVLNEEEYYRSKTMAPYQLGEDRDSEREDNERFTSFPQKFEGQAFGDRASFRSNDRRASHMKNSDFSSYRDLLLPKIRSSQTGSSSDSPSFSKRPSVFSSVSERPYRSPLSKDESKSTSKVEAFTKRYPHLFTGA